MKHSFIIFLFALALNIQPAPAQNWQNTQVNQDPNRIRVAQDFERRGNFALALKIYAGLYAAVPGNQLYYDGVKRNMIRLRQFDDLIALIQAQIQKTNHVRFRADLGDVFYKQGDQEKAFETWYQAITQLGRDKSTYTYIANAMVNNQLYEQAADVYLQGRKHFKNEDLFVFELANIYVMRIKYKEATLEYLKHLENFPNQFAYIEGRIVNFTKEQEQAREVAAILNEAISGHSQQYLVRKLLADLYLRIEEYALALEQFRKLEKMDTPARRQKYDEGKELFFFAEKALNAGKYPFAEEAYNMIVTNYPNSSYLPRAMYGLAVSKQKQGLMTEALRMFESVVQLPQKSPWRQAAQFEVGEIYFKEVFDLDKAIQAYQKVIDENSTGNKVNEAYFRIGDCYAAQNEFDKALTWYERSLKMMSPLSPNYEEGNYRIAYLHFVKGDYEQASAKLTEITAKLGRPDVNQNFVNDALELTFLIDENRDKSEGALKLYSQAEKNRLTNDYNQACEKLLQIVSEYPSAAVLDDALNKLGDLEDKRGNYKAAIGYFEKLVSEHEESPFASLAQKRIAEIYETGLGDLDRAYQEYEKVLVDYPQSIYLEEVRHKLRELNSRQLNN